MVVGGAVGRYGERGLFLVKKYLEKHILIFWILTVEDELDVGTHREDAVVHPPFVFELFHILNLDIVAVEAQQTGEGQHNRLMAETQCGTRAWQGNATVGLFNDLPQKVTLREGLLSTVQRVVAEADVPVPEGYHLVWEDNFDGDSLSEEDWNYEEHEVGSRQVGKFEQRTGDHNRRTPTIGIVQEGLSWHAVHPLL